MIYTLTDDDALDLWFATNITEICFGAERTINSTGLRRLPLLAQNGHRKALN